MTSSTRGTTDWGDKEHGTRVEIELVAAYRGGRTGVQEYLEQTVVANPHLALVFVNPKGERMEFPRVTSELPREAQEIKPHPHGVELGMLQMMLQDSGDKTVKQVLCDDFSRISPAVAAQVCERAKVNPKTPADKVHGEALDRLHTALGEVKVMAPPATAVVPIGEKLLVERLKRRFSRAEFYVSTTRPPSVYRGNPLRRRSRPRLRGGPSGRRASAEIMRFANRVPLQYQPQGLRDQQERLPDELAGLRAAAAEGEPARRSDGHRRAPRERLGPLHERGEGGRRALRRSPPRDEARHPGGAGGSSPRTSGRARTPTGI